MIITNNFHESDVHRRSSTGPTHTEAHVTARILTLSLTLTIAACTGPAGTNGINGTNGTDGTDGTDGVNGTDGDDGLDRVLDPSLSPLDKMFTALGGRDTLLAASGFTVDADGTRFIAGEGLTPEGEPVAANRYSTTTSVDLANDFARVDTARDITFVFPQPQSYAEIARGELGVVDGIEHAFGFPTGAMSADRAAAFRKQLRLMQPLLLARTIAEGESLVSDGGEALIGRQLFHVLVVEDDVAPIDIYVDTDTGEIARIATVENDYFARDVALEVIYLDWQPTSGALFAPAEAFLVKDGELLVAETRSVTTIGEQNGFEFPVGAAPVANDALAERGARSHQYHYTLQSFGLPLDGVEGPFASVVVRPGVVQLLGVTHNALVIEQANGLVVVDAPLYDERAEAILAEVATRFPGKPVTHVIASHFHEDHVSGIRTLLGATNASLVVSETTEAFWRDILRASSTIVPDALAENPRTVDIVTVADGGSIVLADALRPVTVNDIENGHANDLLVPVADDVAFSVDIYSPGNGAVPFASAQLRDALIGLGLDGGTLRIVGGHGGATHTFAELESAIDSL